MKGKDKIIKKIMDDAKAEVEKINQKLKDDIKDIQSKVNDDIKKVKAEADSKAKHELDLHESKTLAQARLSAKRKLLEAREEIIKSYIEEAVEKISKDKGYESYMKSLAPQLLEMEQPLVIRCSSEDKALVQKIAKDKKIECEIKEAKISGGMIAEDNSNKRLDLSIDSSVARNMDELRKAIISLI